MIAWLDDRLEALRRRGAGWLAAVLLAPAGLLLGAFSLAPMVASVYMSLFGGKQGAGPFVGLGNYAQALGSPDFRRAALVTVYYVAGTVPATLCIGFAAAYALHRVAFARGLLRTLYFLPYVTSAVAAGMVWRALFNAQSGVFNTLLEAVGLPAQQWLLEPRGVLHLVSGGLVPPGVGPSLALCCVMLFDVWHASGFAVVVFLAGLSSIPREAIEAARIDGANLRQTLRHVVLPLLAPTTFFLAVVGVIRGFQTFNSFYVLTLGGGRAVLGAENLILYVYAQFYEYGYLGYGAASATLLSGLIVLFTAVQWRAAGRRVFYE